MKGDHAQGNQQDPPQHVCMGTSESELVSESSFEIIPFFAQILAWIGGSVASAFGKLVAGTQTVLLATNSTKQQQKSAKICLKKRQKWLKISKHGLRTGEQARFLLHDSGTESLHIHAHAHTRTRAHIHTYTHTHIHTYTHTHTYTHIHTHTHTHTYTHTHIHTYTHTHTHSRRLDRAWALAGEIMDAETAKGADLVQEQMRDWSSDISSAVRWYVHKTPTNEAAPCSCQSILRES